MELEADTNAQRDSSCCHVDEGSDIAARIGADPIFVMSGRRYLMDLAVLVRRCDAA